MADLKEYIRKMTDWLKHAFATHTYDKDGVRPYKDWGIILPTFFVSLLVLGLFALYIDMNVQSGTFWTASYGDRSFPAYQINQKDLTTVTDIFSQKEKNLNDLQNNLKTIPPDPSL